MPLRTDEAPLAAEGLVGTPLPGVAAWIRWGQRHTLCIRIRVRYGFGVRRGGFPTFMVSHTGYGVVSSSLDVARSCAPRWGVSVHFSAVVCGTGPWPLWERHGPGDEVSARLNQGLHPREAALRCSQEQKKRQEMAQRHQQGKADGDRWGDVTLDSKHGRPAARRSESRAATL